MKNSKNTYAKSNAHGLTLAQQNAVDLLAAGNNDTATADALKLNRVTVTRWRLYSPQFRAALASYMGKYSGPCDFNVHREAVCSRLARMAPADHDASVSEHQQT